MADPKEHIGNLLDEMHKLQDDGHIDGPDLWVAVGDLETAIHQLRQIFERKIDIKKNRGFS